jgi:hypothetical protein
LTATPLPCPRCRGTGRTMAVSPATHGHPATRRTVACNLCRGTGEAPPWGAPIAGTAADPPRRKEPD